MTTTVSRWGNSLVIHIPAMEATKAAIHEGDKVELFSMGNGKIIKTIDEEIDFNALIESITPENLHGEQLWGEDVGREKTIW
jgi:antitoxin component of MazEF toxin-antitoxin module